MADDSVFDNTNATTVTDPTNSPDDNNTAPTNPDNSTTDDRLVTLEKRLTDKDAFIEQLKSEQAEAREALRNQEKAMEELEQIKQELNRLKQNENGKETRGDQSRANTKPELSEAEIKQLVAEAITEDERTKTADNNIRTANQEVINTLGSEEKARDFVRAKAQELQLSMNSLKAMAAESPTAFLNLINVKSGGSPTTKESDPVKSTPRYNPRALEQASDASGQKQGTKAYWDNYRREHGVAAYMKPSVQNQIMKDKFSGVYDS